MRVDPNEVVAQEVEYILCERDAVVLYDNTSTPRDALADPQQPFLRFCATLEPNRTFMLTTSGCGIAQAQ